ncbi:CDP-alcohol phosphatidyltransferase family protein [Kocuria coralli]|uniref:CDP-alcohol phosphatidyltransferase family protein n=2 Tax=Kocuria coralli TaxID=1461025 RepID=A0A5J5KVF6_9MICC|nr:CDP-alcohol phosphatidyltransferase family protein [Kocuria coralli]
MVLVLRVPGVPAAGAVLTSAPLPAAACWWRARQYGQPITAADRVTLVRFVSSGVLAGAVVLVFTGVLPDRTPLVAAIALMALLSDAVDGWLARRTGTASAVGARLDMEADAVLYAVLCLHTAPIIGWWVILLGAMRYLFGLASWLRPRLRQDLPPSRIRRPIAALEGIALLVAIVPGVPVWLATAGTAAALSLVLFSFGKDIVALERSGDSSRPPGRKRG